ncbi:MAG: translation initiation factor IF-3 [Fidelibacterota bacterium]
MKSTQGGYLIAKQNKPRINDNIKEQEVRLIDHKGEQVGIVSIETALQTARETGLDLVEVAPNAKPPVCKILDYGKIKYEAKKKKQASKKKQHVVKLKEVRIRPHIDVHDLETKLNQGIKFLQEGCKLKVTVMFRGREMSRLDLGDLLMDRVKAILEDVAVIEKENGLEGRSMSTIFIAK